MFCDGLSISVFHVTFLCYAVDQDTILNVSPPMYNVQFNMLFLIENLLEMLLCVSVYAFLFVHPYR